MNYDCDLNKPSILHCITFVIRFDEVCLGTICMHGILFHVYVYSVHVDKFANS